MRVFVRNQIVELLSTVWEGVKQAKALEPHVAESVLTDCYLAVQSVEKALQKGFSPETFVKYSDLLCSLKGLLEGINEGIACGIPVAETTKKLKAELKMLRKTLLEEKEVKLEIVFFPYKASMWDSLESIWLAARDDDSCDAYVIPIPYYDRLPNGEFGAMHCEAELYPDYVPIVGWETYDVEKRRPDMIFIHNPYDDANYVTSVHPDFYNKRLRKCTDLLAYVPYFVVSADIPEHFCTTPGCIYAHKTFIESDNIRNMYMRVFGAAFGNQFGIPKDKFIALGSPKFDKVVNTKREDYTLPEELKNLVAGKKVILYNTSIGAALQYNEQYLIKLQSVLSIFEKRKDAVLWWRPHPLLESTLDSMRPALANQYRGIVEKYRRKAYQFHDGEILSGDIPKSLFVYDDTPDLDRAISISDGYYGDWSSLVAMYASTGKPTVIQDVATVNTENFLRLSNITLDANGDAWGCDWFANVLFKLDLYHDTAKLAASNHFYGSNLAHGYLVKPVMNGEEIVAFPCLSSDILTYHKNTGESKLIPLDCKGRYLSNDTQGVFINKTVQLGDKCYCFTANINAVIVYHGNGNISYDTELYDALKRYAYDKKKTVFPLYISQNPNSGVVTAVLSNSKHIVEIDIGQGKVKSLFSSENIVSAFSADYDGKYYWLSTHSPDAVVRIDAVGGDVKTYTAFPQGYAKAEGYSRHAFFVADCGDYLLLVPSCGNMVVKFDKQTERMSHFPDMEASPTPYAYDAVQRIGDKLFATAFFNKTLYEADIPTGTVKAHQFEISGADYERICGETKFDFHTGNAGSSYLYECNLLGGLPRIIDTLESQQKALNEVSQKDGQAGKSGEAIYNYCKAAVLGK